MRGHTVRLIAIDHATGPGGWLGISVPQSISFLAAIQEQFAPALMTIGVFALDFVMFVVPGFASRISSHVVTLR